MDHLKELDSNFNWSFIQAFTLDPCCNLKGFLVNNSQAISLCWNNIPFGGE